MHQILNCVYNDVDVDTENGYRTRSLDLRFVTIASIIFKNENADLNAKCEWVFTLSYLERDPKY